MTEKIDSIHRELVFSSPIKRVWSAITQPQEVKQWFGSDAHYELIEGSVGYFEWQEECEGKYALRIESIQPVSYFAWRWMNDADVPFSEQGSTLVEWHLKEIETGGTRLILVESGFLSNRFRDMNIEGWLYELHDLATFLKR